ncbi:MAG: cytochrome c oxidase accessory protein CcoG [Sulfuricellaceae bacterium]|nr:cytochrome c oxidase accessory protein CcoG [Sulfuricellaceae bacterium]
MNQSQNIPPAQGGESGQGGELYASRKMIYARSVTGIFNNLRILGVALTQFVFYVFPWLIWNERPMMLFDLVHRKFYVFGYVFFPQDFVYLTGVLVIAAFGLFLFTAVAGRIWCGYACPQTVYTEIFMWIERAIEGDRAQQIKMDKMPWNARKIGAKTAKHGIWLVVALWTGFTFVGFFTPIRELAQTFVTFSMGPWETFWVFFYGLATYGFAGHMREQVCLYMCPYARFQSVMFDTDTLIITYDEARGEPRGQRKKGSDYKAAGKGDCVDCGICVQVCPTGIDIRKGLQYECIGCSACIDGCNQVMDKVGYPRGLIRYSTENVMKGKFPERTMMAHVFRPRVLLYTAILMAIVVALGAALYMRIPLKANIIRDRSTLVRETDEGLLENVYRMQLINMDEKAHRYTLAASGMDGLKVSIKETMPLEVEAASTRVVSVSLTVDPGNLKPGSTQVFIKVQDVDDSAVSTNEKTSFLVR